MSLLNGRRDEQNFEHSKSLFELTSILVFFMPWSRSVTEAIVDDIQGPLAGGMYPKGANKWRAGSTEILQRGLEDARFII
mmetsp:Transcript_41062/g.66076  ORF Transcript_41062/g.66076 Transcript_41062/m.66076 type:complete len:80 (+) Transcript_41062:355-594(+)